VLDPSQFRLFVAYPPDREGRVVQLTITQGNEMDIPAEIFREGGQLMITLFSRGDTTGRTYPVTEFVDAVEAAVAAVDAPIADS
jgi:hypothetical protein